MNNNSESDFIPLDEFGTDSYYKELMREDFTYDNEEFLNSSMVQPLIDACVRGVTGSEINLDMNSDTEKRCVSCKHIISVIKSWFY